MSMVHIDWRPTRKQLRLFGVSILVGFGLIGAWLMFHDHLDTAAYVCWGIAAVIGGLGLSGTKVALPFYWVWMGIAFVMGTVISHVLLGIVFFLLVTPMGLVMRLIGRDRLRLKHRHVESHWRDVPPITGDAPYERQS